MNLKLRLVTFFLLILFANSFVYANKTNHIQTIHLGSGCFWGAEKGYESLDGVIDAVSGYANGYGVSPNYRSIIQLKNKYNENNFAEVVKVTFNSNAISLDEILKHFFETHDPTQLNRQGNDIGTQYRSIIITTNEKQFDLAKSTKKKYEELLLNSGFSKITTEIQNFKNFYYAEEYHQQYLLKNPNGYCGIGGCNVNFNI